MSYSMDWTAANDWKPKVGRRLLRQIDEPVTCKRYGLFLYLLPCTIFMAVAMRVDTSLMLPGMMSVVVASAATLP